jgi:hypothetical protein
MGIKSVEKDFKKCTKKVIGKNVICGSMHFFPLLLMFEISMTFFSVILVIFSNFEAKCAKNGTKNQQTY